MGEDITSEPGVLHTADGVTLEAEWSCPDAPTGAVVLCHPHPVHGGTMRSLVPSELFRHLPGAGVAALRFNFRGVEGSTGSFGGGHDEVLDVRAAVAALAERAPHVPLIVAGWSFGADVSLAVDDPAVAAWAAIAPPLRILPVADLVAAADPRPKLLIVPEHDQFDPPAQVRATTASWTATTIEVVGGADHFLVGRTDRVAALVDGLLASLS